MTPTPHPIESGELLSLSQMARTCPEALKRLRLSAAYPFAGNILPDGCLAPNFMYFGQTGSGKTLELRMLLRNVLGARPWDGRVRPRCRIVIFDAKGEDLMPSVLGWCPPEYLIDLHAYSESGIALHLGKSCVTPEDGQELAHMMIEDSKKSHDFFTPAAQQLLEAIVHTLQLRGGDWFLYDLLIACGDESLLRHVLQLHPRGKSLLREYLRKGVEASQNMLQTLNVKLGPWRLASLLERRAEHYITVDGWLNSGGVIVLRGSSRNSKTIEAWNSFVFRLLVARLRDRAENYPVDETFLFVDETPESILASYREALLLGRIKGVRTAATIQDPGGLIARFGGREQASEAVGQIGNLCVGRLASPDAAEWLSGFFGKHVFWQEKRTDTKSPQGRSTTIGHELREDHNVYPYEFQDFPQASLGNGYEVVARAPMVGAWRKKVDGKFIKQMLGEQPPNENVRRRRKLTKEDIGYTWGAADYARLKIPPPSSGGEKKMRDGGVRLPW
ncbi:MAG: type IV secretory system conjugative DNA transfer family protein [Planctomycetota bacterium]